MGFLKEKIVAPIAGHMAKHTSPETAHRAVETVGTKNVAKAMSEYMGPEASVKMMDDAGPEHMADVMGPKQTATLLMDTLKLGEPKSRHLLVTIGPHRMARMMAHLRLPGAVEAVRIMGPGNAAACTIIQFGANNSSAMFKELGPEFAGQLLSSLGPHFTAAMLKEPGHFAVAELMQGMGPEFSAGMFRVTGPVFMAEMFLQLGSEYGGVMLSAAGVPFGAALFQLLGAEFLATFMQTTGPEYQASMLTAMGVDDATHLFQAAGAELMANLLQTLGPNFNAVLVRQMGKGAMLLGLDLGAGFLAEVASHADASFLASLTAATAGEMVSAGAQKIASLVEHTTASNDEAAAATEPVGAAAPTMQMHTLQHGATSQTTAKHSAALQAASAAAVPTGVTRTQPLKAVHGTKDIAPSAHAGRHIVVPTTTAAHAQPLKVQHVPQLAHTPGAEGKGLVSRVIPTAAAPAGAMRTQ